MAIGKINQLLDFDASPNGLTQAAAVSTAFSGSLGTFPALHKGDTAASYSAVIDWGDGHHSSGTIAVNPSGGFSVGGSNSYATGGTFSARVLIVRLADGAKYALNSTIVVSGNGVTGTGTGSGTGTDSGTTTQSPGTSVPVKVSPPAPHGPARKRHKPKPKHHPAPRPTKHHAAPRPTKSHPHLKVRTIAHGKRPRSH